MSQGVGATAELSRFAAGLRFEALPATAVHDTKRIIADTVACAIGGLALPVGPIVTGAAATLGTAPAEATLLGASAKMAAPAAAFANAALANALDADETLFNSQHHACCVIPATLALAEAKRISGKALIAAAALGFEIGARVSLSLTIARVNDRGDIERFPQTGLGWAVLGCAAGAAKALDLAPEQFAMALGIAAWTSPISSHLKWDHAGELHMMKNSPHGFISLSGVMAARLASLGMTGEPAIFDGDDGYWRLVGSPDCNWEALCGGLGESWWISKTAIKPYAVNRLTHHSIALFADILKEEKLAPDDIDTVDIVSFARVASAFLSGNRAPKNPVEAQFSLPFALAAMAYGSDLGADWCRPDRIADERLRKFAHKVTVRTDAGIQKTMAQDLRETRRYPRVPSRVTVTAKGRTIARSADYAPGDPGRPDMAMSDAQLEDKFMRFTGDTLGVARARSLWQTLMSLESLSGEEWSRALG